MKTLQYAVIGLIILMAAFMAYRRYKNGELGYAAAWGICAVVNVWLLVELLSGAGT